MVWSRPTADRGGRGPDTSPGRCLVGSPLACTLADLLAQPRAESLVLRTFLQFRAIFVRPCRLTCADRPGRVGACFGVIDNGLPIDLTTETLAARVCHGQASGEGILDGDADRLEDR